MARVSLADIDNVTKECLRSVSVSEDSIDIILKTIHYANRRGIPTHGIGRLPLYVKKIRAGHFNPKDEIEIIHDDMAVAILDAHSCFGQVAAYRAVELGLLKARKYGIAVIGVRNSNNFGTAGFFGDMAAREGMAAIIYANASPAIAPTGGTKAIFGTNPMCEAFPTGEGRTPIVFDMATTVAARGKIRLAAKTGERIPLTWAMDASGNPTDDPNEALKGTLLPIAGYKGYGLSLFVDLFAGVLAGAAFGGNVAQLSDMYSDSNNGNLFILIDTSRFLAADELVQKMDYFCNAVKECGEDGNVIIPGERGYREMEYHHDTVVIPDKQYEEINELARTMGIRGRLKEIES